MKIDKKSQQRHRPKEKVSVKINSTKKVSCRRNPSSPIWTKNEKIVSEIEKRFKKVCDITSDISSFPLREKVSNLKTNKHKSKEFSEVFTPLWLADQMIEQVQFSNSNTTTLDLCAGYGQFSVRLIRYFHNTFADFNANKFIRENHAFSELQLSSCYKLLFTFGSSITLFIGDSIHLSKLPTNAKGLWCYIESYGYWVCLTKTIQDLLTSKGSIVAEEKFVHSLELIIKNLNETYLNMKSKYGLTLKNFNTPKLRMELIKQVNSLFNDDKGDPLVRIIPTTVITDMLDSLDGLEKKSILVLFNCEIVEYLIGKMKIDATSIVFATDTDSSLKSSLMMKVYGIDVVNFDVNNISSNFKGRKFDVCLSNPPYNDGLDLKILTAIMEAGLSKEYIWVHPSTWLIDQKGKKALYSGVKTLVDKKLKSVTLFNGNNIFDIDLFVPCAITHIDTDHNDTKVNVNFFGTKFAANSTDNITKFGKSWLTIVKPFKSKIEDHISVNGDVWSQSVKKVDSNSNKHYCQLANIIGNHSKDKSVMLKDDFYTMTIKNSDSNKGIRDKGLISKPTFGFSSSSEIDNFLSYLNTDFARFCLSIYKINPNLHRGELSIVPWLDFTQSWDDEKLFNHFNVNQETQDYIRSFLPDYYGIRK